MAKPLVIVESELKARTLKEQFNEEIDTLTVLSQPFQVSYISPKDKLKKEKISFSFSPVPSKNNFTEELVKVTDRDIYLALDSDERSEYWGWMISEYLSTLSKGARTPKRLNLIGINDIELQESFKLVEPVNSEIPITHHIRSSFNSYLCKHLKRLIGTLTGPGNLPLNYTTLTLMTLLNEREYEIQETHNSSPKWHVQVKLANPKGHFQAKLTFAYGVNDDGKFKDNSQVKEAIALFKDKTFTISKLKRSELNIAAPAPYRFAELLQDAHILIGLSPLEVFNILRNLFHGVQLGNELTGLISSFLPLENCAMAGLVSKMQSFASKESSNKKSKTCGLVTIGEGYIFPTRPDVSGEDLGENIDSKSCRLYELIRKRAVASQMEDASGEIIEAEIKTDQCTFTTTLRSISSPGFLEFHTDYNDREQLLNCPLADSTEGQELDNLQIIPDQRSDFIPEYYSYDSLFSDLSEYCFGLEGATVFALEQMINAQFVGVMPDGSLIFKENSTKVISTLERAFPSMAGLSLSAYIAQTITEVISGRKTFDFAISQFDQALTMQGRSLVKTKIKPKITPRARTSKFVIKAPAEDDISVKEKQDSKIEDQGQGSEEREKFSEPEEAVVPESLVYIPETSKEEKDKPAAEEGESSVQDVQEKVPVQVEKTDEISLEQTEPVPVRDETGIESLPVEDTDSSAVFDVVSEPPPPDIPVRPPDMMPPEPVQEEELDTKGLLKNCPACKRPMILKNDRFGKFWTCSGFPACRHAESFDKQDAQTMLCPVCKKSKLITKITQTGKSFFVCPKEDCEFIAWSQPFPIPCQACGSPYMIEKKNASGRSFLRCPKAGCNYMQPMPGDDGTDLIMDPLMVEEEELAENNETDTPQPVAAKPKKKKVRVRRAKKGSGSSGGKKRKVVVRRKK
jgi:DNA topoisomerase IA/ssDNA-binding Zn-finger/Zn-ribbon topoisomerase 1